MGEMGKTKVLNLYAGIGGNRKLWENVDVTAVEIKPEIAAIYQDFFPDDEVIVGDAHEYLLEHYDEFDFIWSSPPCPTHSRARYWSSFGEGRGLVYPDMTLYQEIIFLKNYIKDNTKWVVENVKPYYEPLIEAQESGRHYFWGNFHISNFNSKTVSFPKDNLNKLQEVYGIRIPELNRTRESKKINVDFDKRKILRNMVHPKIGLHVFRCAFKEKQETLEVDA